MTNPASNPRLRAGLTLDFPQSLGVYDDYAEAQKAVDFLSDNEFPVENCLIVGTDLKQLERVTGRLTTGRVALGGFLSGVWLGLLIGLLFSIFGTEDVLAMILSTALLGDRKSTRLQSSHPNISYAVFSFKKKNTIMNFKNLQL